MKRHEDPPNSTIATKHKTVLTKLVQMCRDAACAYKHCVSVIVLRNGSPANRRNFMRPYCVVARHLRSAPLALRRAGAFAFAFPLQVRECIRLFSARPGILAVGYGKIWCSDSPFGPTPPYAASGYYITVLNPHQRPTPLPANSEVRRDRRSKDLASPSGATSMCLSYSWPRWTP